MFASYLMQIFIVVTAWLAFHIYRILTPPDRSRDDSQDLNRPPDNRIISYLTQERPATRISDQTAALILALADFQQAQIFFMLSVQIAILVALHNPTYIAANSWESLMNNFGILYSLAFGGCLPVLFVMLMLRVAGKKDFYTTLLTLCKSVQTLAISQLSADCMA
jgi:hypothetical protein